MPLGEGLELQPTSVLLKQGFALCPMHHGHAGVLLRLGQNIIDGQPQGLADLMQMRNGRAGQIVF